MKHIRVVGPEFMQLCPAAVQLDGKGGATFLVNWLTFPTAPEFSQKFYMAHELGHYLLQTDSEEEADAFALGALAGTERKSLKKSIKALYDLGSIPYSRLEALFKLAQKIDTNNLNSTAKMKTKINDSIVTRNAFRADGMAEEPINPTTATTTEQENAAAAITAANVIGDIIGGNNRRRAGLRLNNVFFSLESIMLVGILITLIVIACKK